MGATRPVVESGLTESHPCNLRPMTRREYVRTITAMLADPRPHFGGEVELATITGVELVSAGTDIHASTGNIDITREHLAAMANQSSDPAVRDPVLKITHLHSLMFGEAAFGHVTNLRLDDNGTTLIGDIVCAKGLAELIPAAWPDRSIEFNFDEVTQTGTKHAALMHAVAVLGIEEPAVQGLAAVAEFYGIDPDALQPIAAARTARRPIVLSATIDRLYGAYSANVPQNERPEPYMWTREIWLDDGTAGFLISEGEDSGRLFRIPFTIAGDDITFGEPTEVVTEYVAASAAMTIAASSGRGLPECLARDIPRNRGGGGNLPGNDNGVIPSADEGGAGMNPEQLRESLGLPRDATDEQVTARIAELTASDEPAPGEGDQPAPTPTPAPTPGEGADEPAPGEGDQPAPTPDTPEAIAAAVASGAMIVVDAGAVRQLQEDALAGREARNEQLSTIRNDLLSWAVRTGRIAPSSRDGYATMLSAADPTVRQNAENLIRSLPRVLPTDGVELGHGGSPEVGTDDEALYNEVFPDEKDNVTDLADRRGA
jgi:hypothetical protein